MENEFANLLKTSAQLARGLGKHEGNISFILECQDRLTKQQIIDYLQETYDEVNQLFSQK